MPKSKSKPKLVDRFLVEPGVKVSLEDHDPAWADHEDVRGLANDKLKDEAKRILDENLARLSEAQELLYADDRYSVLIVLQAMDAAGKDGTIKHVMSGINPQGCQVYSFKKPSDEELDHDFLWRTAVRLPERGRIGIFNRSYYEEVLVVKVHPELLGAQRLPPGKRGKSFWRHRYEDINDFERHLARNGTIVLKFFLHVSKDEQKRRFLARLEDPAKHWKFSLADLEERGHWDAYQKAYEQALSATSTKSAPWYVVPADHKWAARAIVSRIVAAKIESLDLRYPEVDAKKRQLLEEARRRLEAES